MTQPAYRVIALAIGSLGLLGCNWSQSALAPRGPNADAIAQLSWVMFIGGGLIFLATMGACRRGDLRRRALAPADRRRAAFVVGGGIVFPIVTLTALARLRAGSPRKLCGPARRLISGSRSSASAGGGASTTLTLPAHPRSPRRTRSAFRSAPRSSSSSRRPT